MLPLTLRTGTSACPSSRFYCVNAGHVGSFIPSTRVRDGLCGTSSSLAMLSWALNCPKEPECCDGSDEAEGICPNVCKKVGEEYRERVKAENKLRKTVSITSADTLLCWLELLVGLQNPFDIHRLRPEGEEAVGGRDCSISAGDYNS